jgi:protoporphyrinogen/coproporphyrinogen III oxidase
MHNPSSSVLVVNFVFPNDTPLHPQGFGYLIPRPASGYDSTSDQEQLGILGGVFDSCAISGQDTNAHNLTKITMMLGGPYHLPANPEQQALGHLERVLAFKGKLNPIWSRSVWNKECIPTLMPGHLHRMEEVRDALKTEELGLGRLEVIGAGVGGVSIGDCVEAGRRAGKAWM